MIIEHPSDVQFLSETSTTIDAQKSVRSQMRGSGKRVVFGAPSPDKIRSQDSRQACVRGHACGVACMTRLSIKPLPCDDWPVIKDMLFMPFFWCAFFGPKTLFFRVRVLCQNNPFFGSVFFAENLGEGGGGGEEFWDALLLRGGLNLTCVAAWPKGPQRRKSRGKGRDPLGQKHATWQPTGYNRWPP